MMSVKTLRVSRQGGAAFNTMKNTQIRCGAGWDCTHRPLAMSERSLIAELLPQTASSFGPPHPSRIVDRTPIGLAECPLLDLMSKSQSYMLYGRYHCRFRSYSSLGSRGQLRLSPPGSRCLVTPPALAMRDLLQVCRLRLSCCQHVKELCCLFRREDSHSPSCPGMGGTALMLLRWPSSREAMKLTKLRNVLRCLLHPYDAVFRLQPAVHELAVVEFRAPYMGIAVSFRKSLPGGFLIVEDVLCHVSLIVHDCYLEEIHSCVVLVV